MSDLRCNLLVLPLQKKEHYLYLSCVFFLNWYPTKLQQWSKLLLYPITLTRKLVSAITLIWALETFSELKSIRLKGQYHCSNILSSFLGSKVQRSIIPWEEVFGICVWPYIRVSHTTIAVLKSEKPQNYTRC